MIDDPDTGEALRVIDVHQHLGFGEGTLPSLPVDPRLRVLDRFGIDAAVLLPPSGAFGGTPVSASHLNQQTAAAVAQHPDRFLAGAAHVEMREGPEQCRRVIMEAVTEFGLRGAVWHHRFQGIYVDDPAMVDLLRLCAQLEVPALIHVISHSALEAIWRLENLLRQCPDTIVCALDGFSSPEQSELIVRAAEKFPALCCDMGAMMAVSAVPLRQFLEVAGPERLLLGTDLYMQPRTWNAPAALYEVLHMDLAPLDKQRILSTNALELFGTALSDATALGSSRSAPVERAGLGDRNHERG